MKKTILLFIAILSIGIKANAQNNYKEPVVTNLSAERFKIIIANDKNAEVIDLRTADEIKNGYIKGAKQIDFLAKDAEAQIDKLDKTKIYYVYCAGGGRSAEAAEMMEKKGFLKVYNLEKGFAEWKEKGFPVENK